MPVGEKFQRARGPPGNTKSRAAPPGSPPARRTIRRRTHRVDAPDHPVFPEGDVPEQILACPVAGHRLGESLVGDAFHGVDPDPPATFGAVNQLSAAYVGSSWSFIGVSSRGDVCRRAGGTIEAGSGRATRASNGRRMAAGRLRSGCGVGTMATNGMERTRRFLERMGLLPGDLHDARARRSGSRTAGSGGSRSRRSRDRTRCGPSSRAPTRSACRSTGSARAAA